MTIADNLAPYVNAVFDKPLEHSASQAIMAMVLFSFQIYADFYGYSIVAVGSARLLGIPVMDNFKTPYLSASIGEFWSRWHISLSSWFRDYLYIPLGGNRVPLPRWVLNILIVFIVSGLWHGASWTFVAWGAIHGVMLVLETLFRGKATTETGVRRVFGIAVTFVIVTVAWVFFRASSFGNAWDMFRAAAGGGTSHPAQAAPPVSFAVMLVCLDIFTRHNRIDRRLASYPAAWRWSIYTVLLFGLLALAGTEKFPFIYFQF